MDVIIEFFTTLGNSFLALLDFIISYVGDIIHMITVYVELIPAVPAFFTWLPNVVIVVLRLIIGAAICLRIFGMSD